MIKSISYVAFVLSLFAAAGSASGAVFDAASSAQPEIQQVNFTILDPADHHVIGHARYRSEHRGGYTILIGKNEYNDGEHDVEREEIAFKSGELPRMLNFEHDFFNPDGSRKLVARADPRSGEAVCISYRSRQKHEISKKLSFPPDTYVGAAAVVLMETAFRESRDRIDFHTFDCTPGPSIIAVTAHRGEKDERWARYPKPLVRVKLTAKLGWLDFIGNLLPHRNAWFDPRDWQYVGGTIQRYLATGPQVVLVRNPSSQGELASSAR
jgi:hypothetical protein